MGPFSSTWREEWLLSAGLRRYIQQRFCRTFACPDVSRYPGKVVVVSFLLGDQLGVVFSFLLKDKTVQANWGNKVS